MPEEQTIRGTPDEREIKECACGCGKFAKAGNRYLSGHSGGPRKGHPCWNTGKTWFKKDQKWTDKQLETQKHNFKKLFKNGFKGSRYGKPVSLSQRVKQSAKNQGVSLDNWNGFSTPKLERLRKSTEYELWRISVFTRDNYTCQICGERGGKLHADHIKSFKKYPELRFAIDNGRTLCIECHKQTDNYGWRVIHG